MFTKFDIEALKINRMQEQLAIKAEIVQKFFKALSSIEVERGTRISLVIDVL